MSTVGGGLLSNYLNGESRSQSNGWEREVNRAMIQNGLTDSMSAEPVKLAGKKKRSAQEKKLVVGIASAPRCPATTPTGKGKRRRSAPLVVGSVREHMAELVKRVEILENAMTGLSSKYGVPVEELAQNIIGENLDGTTRDGIEVKRQELQDTELKHEGMQAQDASFKDLSSASSPGPASQSYADMSSSNQVTTGLSSSSVSPASEVQDAPNPYIIPDPQFVHPSAPDMLEPQAFFRQEYNDSFILGNDRTLQSSELTMHHSTMDTFTTMPDSWEQHF
ncbi:hypothetical protein BDW72DRAFT_215046 [Aspergillus terricola var. indicus]